MFFLVNGKRMSKKSYKVGIGMSTYNRPEILKWTLKQLLEMKQPTTQVVVSDDGSTNPAVRDVIRSFNVPWTTGPNCGSVGNKNRLLRLLCDCDYIFIIEDDLLMLAEDWEQFWINGYLQSGIHHFTFSPHGPYGDLKNKTKFDDVVVEHTAADGGTFSFYTKKVIETCGGFSPKFNGMGWGHCEFSERIFRAGLTGKYKINHLLGSKLYVKLCEVNPTFTKDERKQWSADNRKLWEQSRKEKWIKCKL